MTCQGPRPSESSDWNLEIVQFLLLRKYKALALGWIPIPCPRLPRLSESQSLVIPEGLNTLSCPNAWYGEVPYHTKEKQGPLFPELSLSHPALSARQEMLKQNSLPRTGLEGTEIYSDPETQGGSCLQKLSSYITFVSPATMQVYIGDEMGWHSVEV